jgi:hypothetical protein
VISRNTASTFRSRLVDANQIGRELGVRYVLEGSIRRSGNQLRANIQLIDAESDAHLWAERFDGDASDLFAVQNEITSRIAPSRSTSRWSARKPLGPPGTRCAGLSHARAHRDVEANYTPKLRGGGRLV